MLQKQHFKSTKYVNWLTTKFNINDITKFNSDYITADLIPKLSIGDFKSLGLTDHGIMNLRVRCCIFWGANPQKLEVIVIST